MSHLLYWFSFLGPHVFNLYLRKPKHILHFGLFGCYVDTFSLYLNSMGDVWIMSANLNVMIYMMINLDISFDVEPI